MGFFTSSGDRDNAWDRANEAAGNLPIVDRRAIDRTPTRERIAPQPQPAIPAAMDAAIARDRAEGRDPWAEGSHTRTASAFYSQAMQTYGIDQDTAAALVRGVIVDTSSAEYAAWYAATYGNDYDGDYLY